MKRILVIPFALFIAKHSSAKVSVAPEVGVQMVKMNEKTEYMNGFSYVAKPGYKSAFRAGMNFAVDIKKSVSIHAGLFYTGRGYRVSFMGDLVKANLDYVDIPVYVNYNIINKKGNKLFVGAGPYISHCLGGRLKLSSPNMSPSGNDKYYLSVGSDATYNDIKALDFGANANLGFVSATGIYVRAHYSLGLYNTIPGGDSKNSLKNTGFGISFGYQIKL